jgi:hypothetical protein
MSNRKLSTAETMLIIMLKLLLKSYNSDSGNSIAYLTIKATTMVERVIMLERIKVLLFPFLVLTLASKKKYTMARIKKVTEIIRLINVSSRLVKSNSNKGFGSSSKATNKELILDVNNLKPPKI